MIILFFSCLLWVVLFQTVDLVYPVAIILDQNDYQRTIIRRNVQFGTMKREERNRKATKDEK